MSRLLSSARPAHPLSTHVATQVTALQRELDSADARVTNLSQALQDEIRSKELLASELHDTNEKMRGMRRKIAKERFNRVAVATIAKKYVNVLSDFAACCVQSSCRR